MKTEFAAKPMFAWSCAGPCSVQAPRNAFLAGQAQLHPIASTSPSARAAALKGNG